MCFPELQLLGTVVLEYGINALRIEITALGVHTPDLHKSRNVLLNRKEEKKLEAEDPCVCDKNSEAMSRIGKTVFPNCQWELQTHPSEQSPCAEF